MLDYGDLQFDSIVLANEIKNLVEVNTLGKSIKERIIEQVDKGVSAKTLYSETQKAFVICSTNLLIHSLSRYTVMQSMDLILKNMKEKADSQGMELNIDDPNVKNHVTALILSDEKTIDRLSAMITSTLDKSKETIKEMDPNEIHIDRLYGLPEGTSSNIALELFLAITSDNELFKTYTHLLIVDDLHGTFTCINLDPKIVTFTKRETNTEEEVND